MLLAAFNSGGVINFEQGQICTQYGNPVVIVRDRDQKFNKIPVQKYAMEFAIKWKCTSAYNLRGNAKVERMIATVKRVVKNDIIIHNE